MGLTDDDLLSGCEAELEENSNALAQAMCWEEKAKHILYNDLHAYRVLCDRALIPLEYMRTGYIGGASKEVFLTRPKYLFYSHHSLLQLLCLEVVGSDNGTSKQLSGNQSKQLEYTESKQIQDQQLQQGCSMTFYYLVPRTEAVNSYTGSEISRMHIGSQDIWSLV